VHYCYILRCADGSFYVGVAQDPDRRCQEHNEGKGAVWTSRRLPVEIVWTEKHDSLSLARTRENQLKRWSREKKQALIAGSLRLRSGQA
jgi:putative endonuclease